MGWVKPPRHRIVHPDLRPPQGNSSWLKHHPCGLADAGTEERDGKDCLDLAAGLWMSLWWVYKPNAGYKPRIHQRQLNEAVRTRPQRIQASAPGGTQILLSSTRLLQIREQGSACYKLSQSQKRANLVYKKQVFISPDLVKPFVWRCC